MKLRSWHLCSLIGIGILSAGISIGISMSKHSVTPVTMPQKLPPINITVWVPDRDIKYSTGTLPSLPPRWKVGMHGKL